MGSLFPLKLFAYGIIVEAFKCHKDYFNRDLNGLKTLEWEQECGFSAGRGMSYMLPSNCVSCTSKYRTYVV